MNTLFAHIPKWIQGLFPGLVWRVQTKQKELYLTFDDGPTPEITEWTLDLLKKYGAKATFFCLGRNCVAHPLLFQKITAAGHRIGNHSFDHKKGWKTSTHHYVQNILKAEEIYKEKGGENDRKLFRPPYGKLLPSQIRALKKKGYRIVFWDVLSLDFDTKVQKKHAGKHLKNTVKKEAYLFFTTVSKRRKNSNTFCPKSWRIFQKKATFFYDWTKRISEPK